MNFPTAEDSNEATRSVQAGDTAAIIRDIASAGTEFVRAEVELLRVDVMQELTAEIILTRRLIIGSAVLVVGACMVLVGIVFLLSTVIAPWLAALGMGIALIATGFWTSLLAWRQRQTLDQIKTKLFSDVGTSEWRSRLLHAPKTPETIEEATKSFVEDIGMTPQTDAITIGDSMANAAELRARSDALRLVLAEDVAELRKVSDRYVHVAEEMRHWLTKAEAFSAKHPNIAKLMKLAIHDK
jgi:Putative Actinobacterial Holin-X, holin superfamily III